MSDSRDMVAGGLVTVVEAAAFLSVSRTNLYNLMNSGQLPYIKLGRSRRIPRRALVELAADRLVGGSDQATTGQVAD